MVEKSEADKKCFCTFPCRTDNNGNNITQHYTPPTDQNLRT